MTTKAKKSKAAKRLPEKVIPVKAWEKLKGRGPFPSVAAEAYFGKSKKKK